MQFDCMIFASIFVRLMNYLPIILSFYILALSLLPCGDVVSVFEEVDLVSIETAKQEDQHEHSNNCNDDPCSPICGCSCCSIIMDYIRAIFIHLVAPQKPSVQLPNTFNNKIGILSIYDIWQPPKLS